MWREFAHDPRSPEFAPMRASDAEPGVGLKCGQSREEADEWLIRYPDDASVMAYIGRSGWNNLAFAGAIADEDLVDAADESYRRVVEGLPKKLRPDGWDQD